MAEIYLSSAVGLAITNKNSIAKLPENSFSLNYSAKKGFHHKFLNFKQFVAYLQHNRPA